MSLHTNLRLKHLMRSSDLLTSTCSTTSAYLTATAHELADHLSTQIDKRPLLRCSICGSKELTRRFVRPKRRICSEINSIRFKPDSKKGKIKLDKNNAEERAMKVYCNTCCRTAKVPFQLKARDQLSSTIPTAEGLAGSEPKESERVSSKKRAKIRRDRAGLQSLIDKNKQESQATSKFSLTNFFKT